jgi:uncharacterized caspase-like protein
MADAAAAGAAPARCRRRAGVALCVGVSGYATAPLRTPRADAAAVAAALRRFGFKTTLLEEPRLEALLDGVEAFAETLSPDDAAVFFFAGHAVQGGAQDNYLIPVEGVTKETYLRARALRCGGVVAARSCRQGAQISRADKSLVCLRV